MHNLNDRTRDVSRSRLGRLQARLGARQELAAGLVILVMALGAMAFTLITGQGTATTAAIAYMAAVDRAETNYVWNNSILDTSGVSTMAVALVDRKALVAQLAATAHTRTALGVQGTSVNGDTSVTVTYHTAGGQETRTLIMRAQGLNAWYVVLHPAGLDITVPGGAGGLVIDGQAIEAKAGTEIKVAVFPGTHSVALAASDLYVSYTGQLDAESALPKLTPVSFSKAQLTDQGTATAKQVASQALASCARSGVLSPNGCPQSFFDVAAGPVSWTVVGDPLNGSTIGLDPKSTLQVSGHFVMSLNYTSQTKGHRLLAVGGPYVAALGWNGQAFTPAGFNDASAVPDATQPAATDAQVLAALKVQMDSCLRAQDPSPLACPQSVSAFFASNFTWHADSDPMLGASAAWDGKRTLFTVSGNFAFSVDYDSTPPYSGTRRYHDTDSGPYTADLFWDSAKVVFVAFEK